MLPDDAQATVTSGEFDRAPFAAGNEASADDRQPVDWAGKFDPVELVEVWGVNPNDRTDCRTGELAHGDQPLAVRAGDPVGPSAARDVELNKVLADGNDQSISDPRHGGHTDELRPLETCGARAAGRIEAGNDLHATRIDDGGVPVGVDGGGRNVGAQDGSGFEEPAGEVEPQITG